MMLCQPFCVYGCPKMLRNSTIVPVSTDSMQTCVLCLVSFNVDTVSHVIDNRILTYGLETYIP